MRSILPVLAIVLMVVMATGGVYEETLAIGAPSENFSALEAPLSDNATPEMKPTNYTLLRATEQSQTAQPSFNCAFVSTASGGANTVTGNENWEILIDINLPGWLYIYEYYPSGIATPEQWVAYKWQPGQSGVWQIGPFTAAANQPVGKHIYRIWFYAEGKWASTEDPKVHYKDLEWTYIQGAPAMVTPVTPPASTTPAPAKQDNNDNPLFKFLTNPFVLLAGPSVIVVIIILLRYFISGALDRKAVPDLIAAPVKKDAGKALEKTPDRTPKKIAGEAEQEKTPEPEPEGALVVASARLVLPGDLVIKLNGKARTIGRADLGRVMELDQLGAISRKHFKITFDQDSFFIEDNGSANGTSLNGKPIAGQGPVKLNDGDLVEPADAVSLKFQEI